MSVFVFAIVSPALANGTPASDLDGHEWTFTAVSRESAEARANRRLDSTFGLASRLRVEATSLRFVGEFKSLESYRKAQEAAA